MLKQIMDLFGWGKYPTTKQIEMNVVITLGAS